MRRDFEVYCNFPFAGTACAAAPRAYDGTIAVSYTHLDVYKRQGGTRPADINQGHFLLPTVLADVPDDARIMREEPFAPVAPIAGWDDFDDVIARANSTEFGLAAYVFTENAALAARTADALEAGMIGINETLLATAEAPFGGTKQSVSYTHLDVYKRQRW